MKTKCFMLMYIIVLGASPIMCTILDLDFINNIACAATISGYCFAIGDWHNAFANEWKRYRLSSSKSQNKYKALLSDFRSKIYRLQNANQQIIEKHDKNGWPDSLDRKIYINIKKDNKKYLSILNSYFDKKGNFIDYELKTQKRFETLSLICFSVGLLVFFVIVFIKPLFVFFNNHQNIYSIYGCVMVLLNYYFSDSADERVKNKMNERKLAIKSLEERCKEYELYCKAYDCVIHLHENSKN